MSEALVIGRSVARATVDTTADGLLEQAFEIAAKVEGDWDVVGVGDYLAELEIAARNSLSGKNGFLLQVGLAIFGGVRGTGLPALVRELGLAANRAAFLRRDAYTAFVFKDATLVDALAKKGGPRLAERRERGGLVAVLANPGQDVPWRRRRR
jgi:hypothetical protein